MSRVFAGEASFANGYNFRITLDTEKLGYHIHNLTTGVKSYATTYAKAWSSISFMARIRADTRNTTRWKR